MLALALAAGSSQQQAVDMEGPDDRDLLFPICIVVIKDRTPSSPPAATASATCASSRTSTIRSTAPAADTTSPRLSSTPTSSSTRSVRFPAKLSYLLDYFICCKLQIETLVILCVATCGRGVQNL
jgi:hypothetical protein